MTAFFNKAWFIVPAAWAVLAALAIVVLVLAAATLAQGDLFGGLLLAVYGAAGAYACYETRHFVSGSSSND